MTTNESYLSMQSLITRNTTAEIHNILQTYTMNTNREPKRTLTINQPKGTIAYTVGDRDTIEKIALQFNSTPCELSQLNKLHSRILFPGQVLYVPEDHPSDEPTQEQTDPIKSSTNITKPREGEAFVLLSDRRLSSDKISSLSSPLPSPPPTITPTPTPPPPPPTQLQHDVGPMVWSMTRQLVARPGRAHRLQSDSNESISSTKPRTIEERLSTQHEDNKKQVEILQKNFTDDENHQLNEECLQRFIKLNVRLMTNDRQSVSGTLLITPNAIMFDPDVLDPLVKEHGIDKYALIIQMQLLAGIALYEDFAMFEHEATARDKEKRKSYHSTSVRHSQLNHFNLPSTSDTEEIHELMSNLLDKIEADLDSSTDTYMLFDASSTLQRRLSKNIYDDQTFLPTTIDDDIDDAFQPLNEYRHSIGILLDDEIQHEKPNYNHVPSQGCRLENCVPIDQFNKRFSEIDKLLHQQQQNYFTPHPIELPYYLCVKTTVYNHDIPSLNSRRYQRRSEKYKESVHGKEQLEYEYWFAVPKEKTDHLYAFFLRWTPEREFDPLIDDVDELTKINKHEQKSNKGFVVLANEDPDLSNSYPTNKSSKQKQLHYLKRQNTLLKEWEIITVDEIYRRIGSTNDDDDKHSYSEGLPSPTLLQPSILINEEQSKQILLELPQRYHGLNWYLTFSTEANGFSLNQLYRRCFEIDHDLPSLIIIKDVDQNMFGAFVSHQLVMSDSFYGNGESFLFTYYPDFRVFNWSGANEFFVKGDINGLGFGSGEGTYGLWIDGDLYHGRSSASKTYNNEPLTINEDFLIANIEVWTFID